MSEPLRRCRGRCWFSLYGLPGVRAPFCQRCGRANPRKLTQDEQDTYDYFVAQGAKD